MKYDEHMTVKGKPRTEMITVRMTEAGLAAVDQLAVGIDVTRAEMIRLMLRHAAAHPPRIWKG